MVRSNIDIFNGIHAVLFALFQQDEQLDLQAMEQQIKFCINQGCHGINVLGLATEVHKLSLKERMTLINSTAEVIHNQCIFSVTISGNSIAEQVELIRQAEIAKADSLILQPPICGHYPTETYLDFFQRVASNTELPIAIQNAPAYLGRSLSAEDIQNLQQRCPNLAAVKSEESAASIASLKNTTGDQLLILAGRGGKEMIESLEAGSSGFVLAPDIAPTAVHIFNLWHQGNKPDAETLYNECLAEITFTMQSLEHLAVYGKRVFAEQANLSIHDRAPSLPLSKNDIKKSNAHAMHLKKLLSIH